MQLILTPPPEVMVILKEISFNYGSPGFEFKLFKQNTPKMSPNIE